MHAHATRILSAALALVPAVAFGQQGSQPSSKPDPSPAHKSAAVEFDLVPLKVDELGLEISLPVGIHVDAHYFAGGRKRIRIADNAWVLQIFQSPTSDRDIDVAEVLDDLIDQRRDAVRSPLQLDKEDIEGTGRLPIEVFDRIDDLRIDDRAAARAYLRNPKSAAGYEIANTFVSSYTVVNVRPGEFMVFQFDTPPENLEGVRRYYETIVASTNFTEPDADEAIAIRAAVLAGDRFLDTITPDDISAAMPAEPVYLRIYQPGPTGADSDATEVAYQKVEIREGMLGELDPERPKIHWKEGDPEREMGYLVRVDGRFLDEKRIMDMRAIFWLSTDFERESAAVTTTATVLDGPTGPTGQNKASFQTIFERVGDMITVKDLKPGVPEEARDWVAPPQGYIPAVTRYLLPRLVASKGLVGEFGFYHYDLQSSGISLMRSAFTKSDFGWQRADTRPGAEDTPMLYTYTKAGELVTNTWPNGIVMEPIEQERLTKIWRSKGHPIR